MLEILLSIILAPIALVVGVFTIALTIGFIGGLFKRINKRK